MLAVDFCSMDEVVSVLLGACGFGDGSILLWSAKRPFSATLSVYAVHSGNEEMSVRWNGCCGSHLDIAAADKQQPKHQTAWPARCGTCGLHSIG